MNQVFCDACNVTFGDFCKVVKQGASDLFKSLGYHVTEKIYQQALANYLKKQIDSHLKCVHALQTIESESIIDVIVDDEKCGILRSDLQLFWKIQPEEENKTKSPEVIIELKATSDNLNERAVIQLIAYMRITNIKRGILVNFLQRSEIIDKVLRKRLLRRKRKTRFADEIHADELIFVSLEKLKVEPQIELKVILLE